MPSGALRDYYEVLQVPRTAPLEHIRYAYRKIALEYHPDVNTGYGAAEIFKRAQEAYEVLSDPGQRVAYDERLASYERRQAEPENAHANRTSYEPSAAARAASERELLLRQLEVDQDDAARAAWQGLAWCVGGAVVSWLTYSAASTGGGYYFVTWGAVIYGGIRFVRGMGTYLQVRSARQALTPGRGSPFALGERLKTPLAVGVAIALIIGLGSLLNRSPQTSGTVRVTIAPTFATVAPTIAPTPRTTFTFALTARPVPTPVQPRAVALRPEQMILPPAEFPFTGFQVSADASGGADAWDRTFRPSSPGLTSYHFLAVRVVLFSAATSGYSIVAAHRCLYVDPLGRPVRTSEIAGEVVGDGAKACRYDIDPDIVVYEYISANRNVGIRLGSNPSVVLTDATAMRDLVAIARAQVAAIDRVAPR